MKFTQNLHTHSNLSDGLNTLEEIVLKAIDLNFDTVGFSDHSPMPFDAGYDLNDKTLAEYLKESERLKKKYSDKIKVLRGLELDMTSSLDLSPYDYIIGSVHCLKTGGDYIDFDVSADELETIINNFFGGDAAAFAKAYYETVANEEKYKLCDIVGHFDIITKNLEKKPFFDTSSPEYKRCAVEALHATAEKCRVFEINTGAISRGYRTSPYPEPFILKEIKAMGCGIIISSDCHDKNFLDCNFAEAAELASACGFTEILNLGDNGFTGTKI